jgi:rare lipoprotein A
MSIQQAYRSILFTTIILSLASCGGNKMVKSDSDSQSQSEGGYYLDDGPSKNVPANIDSIPDARPKPEDYSVRANKPYRALNQQYTPMQSYTPYREEGIASWYGKRYHGKQTSVGEIYDMYGMTAAHTTLPIPSYAKVTNTINGRSVVVRINDRGPFIDGRIIDLSYAAAYKLRMVEKGSAKVLVEAIDTRYSALEKNAVATDADEINRVYTPEAIKPTASLNVVSTDGYFVQVGAYKSQENSKKLIDRVQAFDRPVNIQLIEFESEGFYRVKFGPYNSREAADSAATQLRKQYNVGTIIQKSN